MVRASLLELVVLAPTPWPSLPGTYRLVRGDGRALPAAAPRGVFPVVSGSLTLGAGARADHRVRYVEPGSAGEITYAAEGTHRDEGETVLVEMTGTGATTRERIATRRGWGVPGNGLTRLPAQERDAADVELFRAP